MSELQPDQLQRLGRIHVHPIHGQPVAVNRAAAPTRKEVAQGKEEVVVEVIRDRVVGEVIPARAVAVAGQDHEIAILGERRPAVECFLLEYLLAHRFPPWLKEDRDLLKLMTLSKG